jgi:GAF domain-containing protein
MIYTGVGVTVAEEQHSLGFPDAARARLDESIATLVADAQRVLGSQGRLRSLLDANRLVAEQIELPVVLRTIVEAATSLVGAQYGAIGVIAPDGTLEQFIHVGMTDDVVALIGTLPEGHGILGALIEEQEPIRLENLSDDPRSIGFPTAHPAMQSFLGVPVRVRGEVYGNLYLSQRSGGAFSHEDEELLVALAGTAGAAIDHARLFDESQRRQRWSAASAQVTSALLSDEVEDSPPWPTPT